MATIQHPDTYTCDICGKAFDEESKINIPVLFDHEENECGIDKIDDPQIRNVSIDICKSCLSKAVKVKGTFGFYRQNQYRIEE